MKKNSSVNDILDFAINREIEAHNFYLILADFVEQPVMADVLSSIASVELKHKEKLESVKAGDIKLDPEKVNGLGITEKADDIKPDAKMDYLGKDEDRPEPSREIRLYYRKLF